MKAGGINSQFGVNTREIWKGCNIGRHLLSIFSFTTVVVNSGFARPSKEMKNNLVALKSCDVDPWLPGRNDFLEAVIRNKMEDGEFADVINEIRDILEDDYVCEEDEDDYEDDDNDMTMEETEPFYYERLKMEESPLDSNSNSLLHAGYAECMQEAIRFLVEEENISPEHPIVKNLKTHLEKSKDRILQPLHFEEDSLDNPGQGSPLCKVFLETFQSCRDSG